MSRKSFERSVQIVNRQGLHARPAAELVRRAGRFESEIILRKDGLEVNGKSILGVLMLAAEQGASLTVRAEGPDAEEAIDLLATFVESGFEGMGDVPDS